MPSGFFSGMLCTLGRYAIRRNGADVESAQIVFAAKVSALKRWRDHPVISRNERSLHVDSQKHCVAFCIGKKLLVLNDRPYRVHRAPESPQTLRR